MAEMPETLERTAADRETVSVFSRRDGAFLLAAAVAAACYAFAHSSPMDPQSYHLPGIGLTLTHWTVICAALLAAKRENRLRLRPGNVFLLMISLGLAACFGIYCCDLMRLMNLPVTLLATARALFSLTGVTQTPPLTGAGLLAGLRRFFPACFRHTGLPIRALKDRAKPSSSRLTGVGLGLLLGVPVLTVAIVLLVSADGMFQQLIENSARRLADLDVSILLRLGVAVMGTLCLFSFLYATAQPGSEDAKSSHRAANAVTYFTVLLLLAAVYALFVYVQFRYLFGGGDVASVNGGYAEYARSGFFQLVLLALLTLALILPALILCPGSKPLRALCAALALLTGVIDYSAFFRMRLYIEAYGYTLLRVVTMWGIGMIALALIGVIVKSIRPGIQICPALTVLTLTTWLILNLSNPCAFIARRNLNASQPIRPADLRYVISLSPDVLPEIDRIEDDSLWSAAWAVARDVYGDNQPAAYDWSLGWLRVKSIPPDE